MAKCGVNKKGGVRCQGEAGEGKYCHFHKQRFRQRVLHGQHASPELLAIPDKFHGAYDRFRQREKPFDLRDEISIQRLLLIEMREVLENKAVAKADVIEEAIIDRFLEYMNLERSESEKVERLLNAVRNSVRETLADELDLKLIQDPEDVLKLAQLVESISRIAERMKKIQEGVTLKVEVDDTRIRRLLMEVVFPEVPEQERRDRMWHRAARMSISHVGDEEIPALPPHREEIRDAAFRIEPLDLEGIELEPDDEDEPQLERDDDEDQAPYLASQGVGRNGARSLQPEHVPLSGGYSADVLSDDVPSW